MYFIDFTFIFLLLYQYSDFYLQHQQFSWKLLLFLFQFRYLDKKAQCLKLFLIIHRKLLEMFYVKLLQLFGLERRDLKFATKNI